MILDIASHKQIAEFKENCTDKKVGEKKRKIKNNINLADIVQT